ncbi:Rv3654c family TadE-like protein [Flexivirga lutea]
MSVGEGPGRDRGSATVLVVMGIGVVLLCLCGALALLSAVQASHRARAAADLAALAGARVLVGGAAGTPCETARVVAARNGGSLAECSIAGDDITVSVAVRARWPGLGPARARARAGPDPQPEPPADRAYSQIPPRLPRHQVAQSLSASVL